MKRFGSFFRRYLLFHFLVLISLPLLAIFLFAGVSPSEEPAGTLYEYRSMVVLIGLIFSVLICISWIFFYRLRQRLIRLQEAMAVPADGDRLPRPMSVRSARVDEIGQLEASFNRMVLQLEDSRRRELEEESLRRRLIANLSHDLRTPLTVIRGHASRLSKEPLSVEGRDSLGAIDHTITRVGELMDDLLAYTLLTSGKYPYHPVPTDIVRLARASIASWYPAFEQAGFHIEADLPLRTTFSWEVDPQWMTRVLDNLFQNILRHAGTGQYVGIAVNAELERLTIADRGPGMDEPSADRGAGIGLAITAHMLKEMKLQADWVSDENGTSVTICQAKN
ncbi:two-component sensor histidine kinase [Cohnella sp. CIP 111063]|uniref:HAMP domain-containing sensor histidine kinase n=1 Tax=unclassified Cohnella TaxID=2636738 RepID=UPI000B8C497B|nr:MULTISPECIES: HAMP domain-containing sensor histidine kinase [unclassified Cohnella]OXS52656.1 two-component sensor histidine kinase [Cohnella sp. CIP 111063]PRX59186.1 signal transduction histidine kinase [Cohnella sp. SGD-V74]